jgi:sulfopyruvate decarboxylase TPP-binding subunit
MAPLPWRRRKARPIPAALIVGALKQAFGDARAELAAEFPEAPRPGHLGWILSVPDAQQETVLEALDGESAIRTLPCASEDEASAIAAGLWIGGEPCALSIQHAGLYASLNTLRAVALDGGVPIFYVIGLRRREPRRNPRASKHSAVRYCEPLLDTFGVPYTRLDGPEDVHRICEFFRLAQVRRGPAAVLVGRQTC